MPKRSASTVSKLPLWGRISLIGVFGLALALVANCVRDARRQPGLDAPRTEFTLDGLDCPFWCAVRLTESVDGLDGARVEAMDQKNGKVIVRHDVSRQNVDDLVRIIESHGFAVQAIEPIGSSSPK